MLTDYHDKNYVVVDKGVGFQQKNGDELLLKSSMMIFSPENSNDFKREYFEMLEEIEDIYFEIAKSITRKATEVTQNTYKPFLLLSLADHISYAVERHKNKITIENNLLLPLRKYYPREFEVGCWSLELIKKRTNILLPDDEIAFIGMKLVEFNDSNTTNLSSKELVSLLNIMTSVIENHLQLSLANTSTVVLRLKEHLRFLAQRLLSKSSFDENDEWSKRILSSLNKISVIPQQIIQEIELKANVKLKIDEKAYLTTYLLKMLSDRKGEHNEK